MALAHAGRQGQASVQPAGSASLAFSDPDNATFSYTALGVSGSKSLTREVFSSPARLCP